MNEPTNPKLAELLRLKRLEEPGDEYFENFLIEFHQRQRRADLLEASRMSPWEETKSWIREMSVAKWLYGAGAAYAGVTLALLMWPASPVQPTQLSVPATISLELEEFSAAQAVDGKVGPEKDAKQGF